MNTWKKKNKVKMLHLFFILFVCFVVFWKCVSILHIFLLFIHFFHFPYHTNFFWLRSATCNCYWYCMWHLGIIYSRFALMRLIMLFTLPARMSVQSNEAHLFSEFMRRCWESLGFMCRAFSGLLAHKLMCLGWFLTVKSQKTQFCLKSNSNFQYIF